MTRLGIAIDTTEKWDFFSEIHADLRDRYQTSLFEPRTLHLPIYRTRINRFLFHRDMQAFLQANDVVFFEWGTQLLATSTHLEKSCGIVARLQRYELYEWADRINWDMVDCIIFVSKAKQQEFTTLFPGHSAKTVVVPNGVSLEKFHPAPKGFSGNLGILCNLMPRKRVYDLVLTFGELAKERDDLHLHIAGGHWPIYEDYYTALQYLISQLDLQDRITFHGHLNDPSEWYRQIDIFISNSYSEGLQVAPIEAMASGCYCLIHRWHGAEELLPEEHLFFTSTELIEKILKYCDYTGVKKQRQREMMRNIACEKYDIGLIRDQILEVIDEVATNL